MILTESSANIIALTVLLIVIFRFESLISTICDSKETVQFKCES